LTEEVDPEVKQRWLPLCILKDYRVVDSTAKEFVGEMGRMKYLRPIYQALVDAGRKQDALSWFDEFKEKYHPIAK